MRGPLCGTRKIGPGSGVLCPLCGSCYLLQHKGVIVSHCRQLLLDVGVEGLGLGQLQARLVQVLEVRGCSALVWVQYCGRGERSFWK